MKNVPLTLIAIFFLGFTMIPHNETQSGKSIKMPISNSAKKGVVTGHSELIQSVKSNAVNDDRLMAFYPFVGDAEDVSGNGHHGTVSGAVLTTDRFNFQDNAYQFDGINDSIGLWNGFQYPSMTICAWIYPVYNNDSNKSIFMEYDNDFHFNLAYAPGESIYVSLTSSGEVRWHRWIAKCPVEFMDIYNKWVFTSAVINEADDSVYLYINTELVGSACINGYTVASVLDNVIYTSLGYSYTRDQAEDHFNGKIDDVRIYNDALSPMEIGELYNLGRKSSWTECYTSVTSNFSSVSVVGTIAWAAGEDGMVFRTTDDGASWTEVISSLESHIYNICAVDSSLAFICVNQPPFNGRIYRTHDAGNTWEIVYQATGIGGFMNAVWMFNTNEGYAFGNPVGGSFILIRTSDGGATWSNLPLLPQYSGELGYPNNFTWRDKEYGWFGTSSGRVYFTTNGGNSWSHSQTPLYRNSGTSFVTHSQGIIGNLTDDRTAFTLDGGLTWTEVAPAGTDSGLFPAGTAVPSPQWWAVSGNEILHLSLNNPVWSIDASSAPLNHIAIKYLPYEDRIIGYAAGDMGAILRYVEIVPRTIISGLKFHDLNGNGIKGSTEPPLSYWPITLKKLDGKLIDKKNTDPGGSYSFEEVPAGEYRVGEISQTDWVQTFPTGQGEHLVVISTGEEVSGKNFGNIYGYRYVGPSTGNWSDSANWTGNQPPGPIHAAIIPGDANVIVDYFPNDSILAMRIQNGGQLHFNAGVGEIKVRNSVQIDAGGVLQFSTGSGSSGIICYGDFINRGTFFPGKSYITFAGNSPKLITREGSSLTFNALEISGENTSLVGNMEILDRLILQNGINARIEDTIFVNNPDTSSLEGTGSIPRGTVKRSIANGSTGNYRFESPHSYIQFKGEGINPAAVSVTPMPNSTAANLRWESAGGIVNILQNTVTVDSVSKLSKWPFGVPPPTTTSSVSDGKQSFIDPINRYYIIKADGGNGFKAKLQLRYEQSEIPAGMNESQLQLFRGPVITDSVNEKWNILSLPLIPDDSHKYLIFPEAVSEAFAYNGGYIVRDSLRFGEGFWLKFPSAGVNSIVGDDRNDVVIPVTEGWNLIGSISYPVPVFSVASMPPGIIASEFFKFTTRYEIADTIKPMHGYWIKTNQSGELHLSAGGELSKLTNPHVNPEEFNKLTFISGNGEEHILYFTTRKKLDCGRYELPPLPPEGCYDIRFATGRMVEMNDGYRPREIAINISAGKYPMVVSWLIVEPDQHNSLIVGDESFILSGSGEKIINDSTISVRLRLGAGLSEEVPKEFALDQNYPNPFNPLTIIKYQLPVDSRVTIRIFNILGQVIQTLVEEVQTAGYKAIEWNAGRYASGVYFYKFEAAGVGETHRQFTQVRKLIIVK